MSDLALVATEPPSANTRVAKPIHDLRHWDRNLIETSRLLTALDTWALRRGHFLFPSRAAKRVVSLFAMRGFFKPAFFFHSRASFLHRL